MNENGQIPGLGDNNPPDIVYPIEAVLAGPDPEVIYRLDSIETILRDIHNSNLDYISSVENFSTLGIVGVGIIAGLLLGYIAARGFFDSWTN
ncbi:hypothetical protein [Acinetobacter baumannii]|uniref:hypothetical protein n=1 Tax=Acinetobacter baumannii TaxID=470 RepID=UPI002B23AF78|nr:hypothetical protein [Acinetobacter baumannii]